ncbi:hypothetical protein [Peribacillus sp. TH14]|uniref:hypothetical protein n=1 Tax=Peribacillus sp. TH14 TaxID=2798481 RepID=UPI0019114A2E|nr:hypothetical protein [Peribacillus sp. TH14]MBK5500306.1 hypothetical protein [Peribacillus sp. TH14]
MSEEIPEEKRNMTPQLFMTTKITLTSLVVAVTIAVKLNLKVRLRTMYIFVNAESAA